MSDFFQRSNREPGAVWGPETRRQKLHGVLPPTEHFSWCAAASCCWGGLKREEGNPYICACLSPTYQLVPVVLPKTAAHRAVLNDIIEGDRSVI